MRHKLFATLLILCFLLTSCMPGFYDDSEMITEDIIETIINALKNSDADTIKTLFSKEAIDKTEELDAGIAKLFKYFRGEYLSHHVWDTRTHKEQRGAKKVKWTNGAFDVVTDVSTYRFSMIVMLQDTDNSEREGVASMYVIDIKKDSLPDVAYRFFEEDAVGIYFDVQRKTLSPSENGTSDII